MRSSPVVIILLTASMELKGSWTRDIICFCSYLSKNRWRHANSFLCYFPLRKKYNPAKSRGGQVPLALVPTVSLASQWVVVAMGVLWHCANVCRSGKAASLIFINNRLIIVLNLTVLCSRVPFTCWAVIVDVRVLAQYRYYWKDPLKLLMKCYLWNGLSLSDALCYLVQFWVLYR